MREIREVADDNRILTGRPGSILLLLLGGLPLVALVVLSLLDNGQMALDGPVWLLGIGALLLLDLLLGLDLRGAWIGRATAPVLATWLMMGLQPALGAIIVSAALAALLRLRPGPDQAPVQPARRVTTMLLTRSALLGGALLPGALVYALIGGPLPLTTIDGLPLALIALLVSLAAAYGTARLVLPGVTPRTVNTLREAEILLLVLILPVVYAQAGALAFVLVLGLMVAQFIRNVQSDRMQQALSNRVSELSMLNTIGQATAERQELDEVLRIIHEQVSALLDISVFYIALYDEDRAMLDFRLVMAGQERLRWPPRPLGRGATEYVIHTRRVLNLNLDDRIQFEEMSTRTMTARYAAFLGVPLMHANQVLGVMAVLGDDHKISFSAGEAQLLQTIGSHVGLAVRNALLYTYRSDLLNHLSLINESAQEILFNESRQKALSAAAGIALRIADADKAAIFLLHNTHNRLQCIESINLPDGYCEADLWPSFETEQWPYVMSDAGEVEHARLGDYRAFAAMPLYAGSIFRGVLLVAHDRPHHYEQRILNMLGILGQHIVLMLDNAQLIEELETHVGEMSQLLQLSRITTSSIELGEIIPTIAGVLRAMLDVESIIVCLSDESQTWLRVIVQTDAQGEINMQVSDFIHMADISEIVELTHQITPLPVVYQQQDEQTSAGLRQVMTRFGQDFVALVPMHIQMRFSGVVLLGKSSPFFFTPQEWQFLEVAINQIASQIRNASLYSETQRELARRLQQLTLVEEIAQQVSGSLDFNEIISNLLEAAIRTTGGNEASLSLLIEEGRYWVIRHQHHGENLHTHEATATDTPPDFDAVLASGASVMKLRADESTMLMIPLLKARVVIGVLCVNGPNEAALRENELLLTRLAAHAVISIDNARFLEERQYEIDRLTRLRELGLRLASADDQQAVVEAILDTAQAVSQADDAAVIQYDGQQLTLLARAWAGHSGWELWLDLAWQAAADGGHQFIANPDAPPEGPHSALAVPIKRGKEVPYILYLAFAEVVDLQERDLQTLELLASQAAGHLENARLHEQLRAGRDQMRTIFDSTRAGMILLDRESCLLQYNPAAETLLRIDLQNVVGDYFPHALKRLMQDNGGGLSAEELEKIARMINLQTEGSVAREFDYSLDGRTTYIEEVSSPVRDQHGDIIGRLLVLRDITEQKQLEIQRSDLTHTMVHDLRGPLAAIINGLDVALVLGEIPENRADSRKLQQSALTSAQRLLRLVNSLLDIAQLENPDNTLKLAPVDFAGIVDTAAATLFTLSQQADIHIRQRIPDDLPPVLIDRDKIERVIINLLDNALRFTPEGGEVLIAAERSADGRWLQVQLADSGPGIPEADRERVFGRFQRVKGQNPLRGQKSSGLGLTSCKLAIEAHGGTIRIIEGHDLPGACFIFTLPIA